MGPTTQGGDPGGGSGPGAQAGLNQRLEAAFAGYVAALEESFAGDDGAALVPAYAAYATEVDQVFRAPALAGRAWELAVRYFRSLQGDTAPADTGRYSRMVQTALDVGQGHQKVLDTYQALVTAVLDRATAIGAGTPEAAFAAYLTEVGAAWSEADPSALSAVTVLAASQTVLAASSVHGLLLEARRDAAAGAGPGSGAGGDAVAEGAA